MMKLSTIGSLLVACGLVMMVGCNKKQPEPVTQIPQQSPEAVAAHDVNSVAGVHWTRPERWGVQPPRQMRIATYSVPAAEGDGEGGECAVFHFGSGQGGDIVSNIDRWVSQFENGKPQQTSKEFNGLKVTLVQIAGTYLAPSGPMMQSSGKKENYRLLGAIVGAPEGSVFFKLTGPAKTIAACESDFNRLLGSLGKQ
ncbi:MAG TPA: hypothetical protein DGH68_01610 [Bacteroidetes bacterium]|nr:hypothetical protein [Bacteroidota bacterium]